MSQLITPDLIQFIQATFAAQHKRTAVLAVSGGIDSAVALALLVKAVGADHVTALLLPYGDQSIQDSRTICNFVGLPATQQIVQNIQPTVQLIATQLQIAPTESVRLGNLMARTRMMIVYDYAKKLDALVCGTENKSEHYLGYFTRFGDAASDLEPISSLYKTQVRAAAIELGLPAVFLEKAPSAGLWQDQTDEQEMGFSYEQADQVLIELVDRQKPASSVSPTGVNPAVVQKVLAQVQAMEFKRKVPYEYDRVEISSGK